MPDMRYFKAKEKFLDYAWDVFNRYYKNREAFDAQFEDISGDEKKNRFLKISSFYKFLIRDGSFSIKHEGDIKFVDYFDETYKFIAILSFIEALYAEDQYIDFYQWLSMRERRPKVFPINDINALDDFYQEYKSNYGASHKVETFFGSLDEKSQNFLTARIIVGGEYKATKTIAKLLYEIRSEFVHMARLVLEFRGGTMFSRRRNKGIESIISFDDFMLLFEDGILQHFCFNPDRRLI